MQVKQKVISCYRDEKIEKFYAQIWLPLEKGFYEDVTINFMGIASYNLKYEKTEENFAVFVEEITLPKQDIYYYFFSYKVSGIDEKIKEKNLTGKENVRIEECFKFSYVTDWKNFSRHSIMSTKKENDSENFKICLELSMDLGFYENVKMYYKKAANVFDDNDWEYIELEFTKAKEEFACYENELILPTYALYYYYFEFNCNGKIEKYKKKVIGTGIERQECFKLSANFDVPDWAKGEVMYQLMPHNFCQSKAVKLPDIKDKAFKDRKKLKWSDKPIIGPDKKSIGPDGKPLWNYSYYMGNFKGAKSQKALDLYKKLNIGIIYTCPIEYAQSNHGYDTIDYKKIDPFLGTTEDVKEWCEKVKKQGIKPIVDIVFNHTGNRSIYFDEYNEYGKTGAHQAILLGTESPYKVFYKFNMVDGIPQFSYWFGIKNVIETNSDTEEWQEYCLGKDGVVAFLMSLGFCGVRVDVGDCFSDNFLEKLHKRVKECNPEGFILLEVWEEGIRLNREYLLSGKGMHSHMNYLYMDALIRYYKFADCAKLYNMLDEIESKYPDETIQTLMNPTSTHDTSRIINILGCNEEFYPGNMQWAWDMTIPNYDEIASNFKLNKSEYEEAKKIEKSYITAMAFSIGIFSIFYGDEVGMQGLHNLANRGSYPWENGDTELLDFYEKMLATREENDFLKTASHEILEASEERYIYKRENGKDKIIVIASRVNRKIETNMPEKYNKGVKIIFKINPRDNKKTLEPYGAIVLKI